MSSHEVERLYRELIHAWNARDAGAMAVLFAPDGYAVGFDGSEMHGPAAIESSLAAIFASHVTGSYVPIVRSVLSPCADVGILRAHVGMVPAGQHDLKSELNAVQTVVAIDVAGGWRIQLLQNTPAAYHGRPDAVASLTAELRQHVK